MLGWRALAAMRTELIRTPPGFAAADEYRRKANTQRAID